MPQRFKKCKTANEIINLYYELIRNVHISDVFQEFLPNSLTEETKETIHCNCPHHESQSQRSFHVNKDKEVWYCHACGIGGDSIQLVEFVQTGGVNKGISKKNSSTHSDARDAIASMINLPPLGSLLKGKPKDTVDQLTIEYLDVIQKLSDLASVYNEKAINNTVFCKVLEENYGFTVDHIKSEKIGYSDNGKTVSYKDMSVPEILLEIKHKYGHEPYDMLKTGAFTLSPTTNEIFPCFNNRIIFPYQKKWCTVYMIGRKTKWTPDSVYEGGKYKKLPTRTERRPYISEDIQNNHFFGEDILATNPEYVVITEGITDALALKVRGIAVISPVTTRFSKTDKEQLAKKIPSNTIIYIANDSEFSHAGKNGANDTAMYFLRHGRDVKIITLPYPSGYEKYHKEFTKLTEQCDDIKNIKKDPRYQTLLNQMKMDVNLYLMTHTKEQFFKLKNEAKTLIQQSIEAIPRDSGRSLTPHIRKIFMLLLYLSPMAQTEYLVLLEEKIKSKYFTITELKREFCDVAKEELKQLATSKSTQIQWSSNISCQQYISRVENTYTRVKQKPDYSSIAELIYQWVLNAGGVFFKDSSNQVIVTLHEELHRLNTSDTEAKRAASAWLYELTGIPETLTPGKTIREVIIHKAVREAIPIDTSSSWIKTNTEKHYIYISMSSRDGDQLVKITPEGVTVEKNGSNKEKIVLQKSNFYRPITYISRSEKDINKLLDTLIFSNFTTSQYGRLTAKLWILTVFLTGYSSIRPFLRSEGDHASAKSTGQKLLSCLLLGVIDPLNSTVAAGYSEGARVPIQCFDNLEIADITPQRRNFLLTASTGIVKTKRRFGTDSEVVKEPVNSLLYLSGIESISSSLGEMNSREFLIQHDIKRFGKKGFLEVDITTNILKHRDEILSWVMRLTSRALKLIKEGALSKIILMLNTEIDSHSKERCNSFFSIMYLLHQLLNNRHDSQQWETLDPIFIEMIHELNRNARHNAIDAHPVATLLDAAFQGYWLRNKNCNSESNYELSDYTTKIGFQFVEYNTIKEVTAKQLFTSLKLISKLFNLPFAYSSPTQLGQRLSTEREVLEAAGFKIERIEIRPGHNKYRITYKPEDSTSSPKEERGKHNARTNFN